LMNFIAAFLNESAHAAVAWRRVQEIPVWGEV
jgi:hypothetical protein